MSKSLEATWYGGVVKTPVEERRQESGVDVLYLDCVVASNMATVGNIIGPIMMAVLRTCTVLKRSER